MGTVPPEMFHRLFYPLVPVVVVVEAEKTIGASLVGSAIPLSKTPPMVGISLFSKSFTLELITKSKTFSINWLDFSERDALDVIGYTSGRGLRDKLAAAALTASRSPFNIVYISEAVAHLECRVNTIQETGDHSLVIADMLTAQASDDFTDYWSFKTYRPALYIGSEDRRGKYLTLPRQSSR